MAHTAESAKNAKLAHFKKFVFPASAVKRYGVTGGFPITHINEPGQKLQRKMPEEHLFAIIKSDPTSICIAGAKDLTGIQKVGQYSNWLMNQYFKIIPKDFTGSSDERFKDVTEQIGLFLENLYKTGEDLLKYFRFNLRIEVEKRDIGQVDSTDELYDLVKNIQVSSDELVLTKAEVKQRRKTEGIDYVFETDKWDVLIPKTAQSSFEVAGPPLTRWCTASSNSTSYFDSYSNKGPLLILRDKKSLVSKGKGAGDPRPVYQFHFQSGQYMDVDDRTIKLVDFLQNEPELKAFFRPHFETAFDRTEFSPEDRTFRAYVQLYGTNEETRKMILNVFKRKVEGKEIISCTDSSTDKDLGAFIELLGYETFFYKLLEYAKRSIDTLEITFTNYNGEGIAIPEMITEFTKVQNMVLSGFVNTLPDFICKMTDLELFSVAGNKHLKKLPEGLGLNPKLNVLNITGTPVLDNLPESIKQRDGMEDVLIVYQ